MEHDYVSIVELLIKSLLNTNQFLTWYSSEKVESLI
jgi:hypothetical protein